MPKHNCKKKSRVNEQEVWIAAESSIRKMYSKLVLVLFQIKLNLFNSWSDQPYFNLFSNERRPRTSFYKTHSHSNGINWGHQCFWTLTSADMKPYYCKRK